MLWLTFTEKLDRKNLYGTDGTRLRSRVILAKNRLYIIAFCKDLIRT